MEIQIKKLSKILLLCFMSLPLSYGSHMELEEGPNLRNRQKYAPKKYENIKKSDFKSDENEDSKKDSLESLPKKNKMIEKKVLIKELTERQKKEVVKKLTKEQEDALDPDWKIKAEETIKFLDQQDKLEKGDLKDDDGALE